MKLKLTYLSIDFDNVGAGDDDDGEDDVEALENPTSETTAPTPVPEGNAPPVTASSGTRPPAGIEDALATLLRVLRAGEA